MENGRYIPEDPDVTSAKTCYTTLRQCNNLLRTHIVTEAMSQQIDELELQLQDYERANNQSRCNEQALEAHLSVWETYSTKSNKIMRELYEACSGRWLLFERLSRNSQKKNNALVKRLQISLRGTVQHIRQIVTKMNDLDASFNSNKEPITLDTVLGMTEESFLTTERYRFEGVQQYLEYMCVTEEVEMLKVIFYLI
ncbi:hypothetical protein BDC45DRAFT_559094 [Circinella umbellata]|nr:hypothetical protein BDC45DRAFT_559094 [Circinella umbellata]